MYIYVELVLVFVIVARASLLYRIRFKSETLQK